MVGVYRPSSLVEALELCSSGKVTLLAGGTDLMVRYRAAAGSVPEFPGDAVHIGQLGELTGIFPEGAGIRIGAATTLHAILQDPGVPDFVKAPIAQIGSPAIRNLATIGGNICNASPAGDSLVMLYALDAVLRISSLRGERVCPVSEFITGPGKTSLAGDEIVKDIIIPKIRCNRFFYRKAGQRNANAIAKLSFYGIASIEGDTIADIRMAFGAVGPTVIRDRSIENLIIGLSLTDADRAKSAVIDAISDVIKPIDDLRSSKDYRLETVIGLSAHFLSEVVRQ